MLSNQFALYVLCYYILNIKTSGNDVLDFNVLREIQRDFYNDRQFVILDEYKRNIHNDKYNILINNCSLTAKFRAVSRSRSHFPVYTYGMYLSKSSSKQEESNHRCNVKAPTRDTGVD